MPLLVLTNLLNTDRTIPNRYCVRNQKISVSKTLIFTDAIIN